jgi:hypothetical protein
VRRTANGGEGGADEEDKVGVYWNTGGLVPKGSDESEDIGPSKRDYNLELEDNNNDKGNVVT